MATFDARMTIDIVSTKLSLDHLGKPRTAIHDLRLRCLGDTKEAVMKAGLTDAASASLRAIATFGANFAHLVCRVRHWSTHR